jgi:hypothetical protein
MREVFTSFWVVFGIIQFATGNFGLDIAFVGIVLIMSFSDI